MALQTSFYNGGYIARSEIRNWKLSDWNVLPVAKNLSVIVEILQLKLSISTYDFLWCNI